MPNEMKLAPIPEIVRYLAVFHRAFTVIANYKDKNPDEALLGGYLADALHNVPTVLWNYDEANWDKPSETDHWISLGLPHMVAGYGAPEPIVALCSQVVTKKGVAAELGLSDDLSNLDLSPPDALSRYTVVIHLLCLTLRMVRNDGNYTIVSLPGQERRLTPWRDLAALWTSEADEYSLYCAYLAQTFLPVFPALVRWKTFDEDVWLQEASLAKTLVPEPFHDGWEEQFKPWVLSRESLYKFRPDPETSESR